jgi:hypothetical protein
MWPPKRSALKALDLDNKDNILGYTLAGDGPLMPVVRIPLQRFQEFKRLYDEFPGHVWCISSETLGLHVWEKLPMPMPIPDIHQATRPRLERIGLNVPEIHPMFGRCFRRPFGQDYFTITEGGLLTNWIDQLNVFEGQDTTPSFSAIYQALRGRLLAQWNRYDRSRLLGKSRNPMPRQVTGDELRQELEEIDAWAAKGFPESYEQSVLIPMTAHEPASPQGKQASPNCSITLSEVCNAEWVQNCHSWAMNGLPCDDSFFLVVSQLARWLFFVELFDLGEDQRLKKINDLLVHFCMGKNNGYISRLTDGSEDEVIEHVGRAVHSGIINADMQFQTYCAIMRQKRERGRYKQVIYLEPLLAATERASTLSPPVGFIMCPTKKADSSPLPASVISRWMEAYRATGRMPRKNKTTGQYPILQKCTTFINALYANGGKGRIGQHTLREFGFRANDQRELLKKIMVRARLITIGRYAAKTASRLYSLTKETMVQLDEQRKQREEQAVS